MMVRHPQACDRGLALDIAASKQVFATIIGIASCGTAGGSLRRNPSTNRSIVRLYCFWSLRYKGLRCPASWMVWLMADNASVTV
jgi:hypothetical protein